MNERHQQVKPDERSEHFRRYSLARWLIDTHATEDIKQRWLKQWPFLTPYLRLLTICSRCKSSFSVKSEESFLEYWKTAILQVGIDAFDIQVPYIDQASSKEELVPKPFDEIETLLIEMPDNKQALLGFMLCLYHAEKGIEFCDKHSVPFANFSKLDDDLKLTAIHLANTYRGF